MVLTLYGTSIKKTRYFVWTLKLIAFLTLPWSNVCYRTIRNPVALELDYHSHLKFNVVHQAIGKTI